MGREFWRVAVVAAVMGVAFGSLAVGKILPIGVITVVVAVSFVVASIFLPVAAVLLAGMIAGIGIGATMKPWTSLKEAMIFSVATIIVTVVVDRVYCRTMKMVRDT